MQQMSNDAWKRIGSSIVWMPELLSPLIATGQAVSLRQAIGWLDEWPAEPPGGLRTVLIGGLQASLEVLGRERGLEFLRKQVMPLLRRAQGDWPDAGIVFGMTGPASVFRVDEQTNFVFMRVPGGDEIDLTRGLWNGAGRDAFEVMGKTTIAGKEAVARGGFHARHLS